MRLSKALSSALLLASILALNVPSASAADAQACGPVEEKTHGNCTSGKLCSWRYKYLDKNGVEQTSSCYYTQAKAEAAKKYWNQLCETVTQYWEKTSCKEKYLATYCDACNDKLALKSEAEASLKLPMGEWVQRLAVATNDYYKNIKFWEKAFPEHDAFATLTRNMEIGRMIREYGELLKHTQEKLATLQEKVNLIKGPANQQLLSNLEKFAGTIGEKLDRVEKMRQSMPVKGYHEESQSVGYLVNGKREGFWETQDKDVKGGYYLNNNVTKKALLRWRSNDRVAFEINAATELEFTTTETSEDGTEVNTRKYVDGILHHEQLDINQVKDLTIELVDKQSSFYKETAFFPNGRVSFVYHFIMNKAGKKIFHGKIYRNNEDGSLRYRATYENGRAMRDCFFDGAMDCTQFYLPNLGKFDFVDYRAREAGEE